MARRFQQLPGATGPTGIHLVTELRKTVATVRVIARSMDKLVQLFPDAEADIRDARRASPGHPAAADIATTVRLRLRRLDGPQRAGCAWTSLANMPVVIMSFSIDGRSAPARPILRSDELDCGLRAINTYKRK